MVDSKIVAILLVLAVVNGSSIKRELHRPAGSFHILVIKGLDREHSVWNVLNGGNYLYTVYTVRVTSLD